MCQVHTTLRIVVTSAGRWQSDGPRRSKGVLKHVCAGHRQDLFSCDCHWCSLARARLWSLLTFPHPPRSNPVERAVLLDIPGRPTLRAAACAGGSHADTRRTVPHGEAHAAHRACNLQASDCASAKHRMGAAAWNHSDVYLCVDLYALSDSDHMRFCCNGLTW